jgi:5-deoxy-glucuronate isomerase
MTRPEREREEMDGEHLLQRQSLITEHRPGFGPGYTAITREEEDGAPGMDFGIHVLGRADRIDQTHAKEQIWVLLEGRARVATNRREIEVERQSLFNEAPTAIHLGPDTPLRICTQSERVEWAVVSVRNDRRFPPRVFWPSDVEPEYRGLGLAQGTCLRNVRLIFDRCNRPDSKLVIGEVVNYPGRWSSYPPHHHAQPELYHYRFSATQGYGHGEVGDRVYKVMQNDTLLIPGMHDHAQVAAPGYAMYYLWIVRHLENDPYDGFEFTVEHKWILDTDAPIWEPNDVPYANRRADTSRGGGEHASRRPWSVDPKQGGASS